MGKSAKIRHRRRRRSILSGRRPAELALRAEKRFVRVAEMQTITGRLREREIDRLADRRARLATMRTAGLRVMI